MRTEHPVPEFEGGFEAVWVAFFCASLELLSPDHLCTLVSLSTSAKDGVAAFTIGGTWGFAHCFGMILVCIVFRIMRLAVDIDVDRWEHIGDYLIGLSLLTCGLYFVYREDRYIVEAGDGSITVHGCECHGGSRRTLSPQAERPKGLFAKKPKKNTFCSDYTCKEAGCLTSDESAGSASETFCSETTPILEAVERGDDKLKRLEIQAEASKSSGLWLGGFLLGLLQGVCCPMAIVSVSLMLHVHTWYMSLIFAAAYVLFSVLGGGLFAMLWSFFVGSALGGCLSPRIAYRASCFVTLAVGVLWITMNAFQMLDDDFAERLFSGFHHHEPFKA